MGDFNPLCTSLYYVYFNLFNIWGNMGIYGSIWERLSAPVFTGRYQAILLVYYRT